jgi:hypothetical protein
MLYVFIEPRAATGAVDADDVHEGDWERVDVLLRRDGDGYEPLALRVHADGRARETAWEDVPRASEEGDSSTHPLLAAELGSHELSPARGGSSCPRCPRWPTWSRLRDLRAQLWYGFGGAWGEKGEGSSTTGPLGPHGDWPQGEERGH